MGWAASGPTRDEDERERVGEIYAVYVDPPRWGAGIGRVLVRRCVGDLKATGFDEVTLWVLEPNARARRFYEGAGLRRDGAAKPCGVRGITTPSLRYRMRLRAEG